MRERRVRGTITIVQEGRFHLRMEQGGTRLFVLSRKAPLEPQDLGPLQRGRARVEVIYREAGTLVAAEALDIGLADPRPGAGEQGGKRR